MYYLLYILFLILLLNLPPAYALYSAVILAVFSLTFLVIYKNPKYLNMRIIENLRKTLLIFVVFALILLIWKHRSIVFFISLVTLLPYYICTRRKRGKGSFREREEEKRRALRTELCFDIELRSLTDASSYKGVTRDISTTGMRVFAPQQFEKGKEYYFRVYLPEETWPLTGRAQIVWEKPVSEGFEYGMIFTQISEQDRGKIALKQGFSLLK